MDSILPIIGMLLVFDFFLSGPLTQVLLAISYRIKYGPMGNRLIEIEEELRQIKELQAKSKS